MKNNRPQTQFTGPELASKSAVEVVDLLRKKEVSPSELLHVSKQRIEQADGPVNAMVTKCYDRAEKFISGLGDREASAGENAGWLAGLPVGIKDLSDVEGVRCTYGSKGLADNIAKKNDPIVDTLEDRGAIVVGKTNTPEMGAGGNTFNEVFGMTRNPWDTRKNAGGSSGGAAVSLATGQVWLSEGSDLAGSLRTPAGYCGIVGLRPSPGVAFGGPMPLGFSHEGICGPMARSVDDCALFLDAMSGYDDRAPLSLPAPDEPFQTAVQKADAKIRIGYAPTLNGFAPVDSEIESIMRSALENLQGEGASVDETCPDLAGLYDTYVTLRAMHWMSLPGRAPKSIMQHYKPTLTANIAVADALTVDDVVSANLTRTTLYHRMREYFQTHDVLACAVVGLEPTDVELEFPTEVGGEPMSDYIDWLRFSFLATTAALPAISVPCGFTKSGMPVGIQLIGGPRQDAKVLQAAKALETVLDLGTAPIDPIVRHG